MRLILASLLLIAGCGGDDQDPHVVGTCTGWTDNQGNPFTGTCEAACTKPPTATAMSCDTVKKLGCASFSFSGTDGCCLQDDTVIRFFECQ